VKKKGSLTLRTNYDITKLLISTNEQYQLTLENYELEHFEYDGICSCWESIFSHVYLIVPGFSVNILT